MMTSRWSVLLSILVAGAGCGGPGFVTDGVWQFTLTADDGCSSPEITATGQMVVTGGQGTLRTGLLTSPCATGCTSCSKLYGAACTLTSDANGRCEFTRDDEPEPKTIHVAVGTCTASDCLLSVPTVDFFKSFELALHRVQ
jgi:hypothetical protein